MGCFLGCFGSSKDRKHKKPRYKLIHPHQQDQKPKIQNLVNQNIKESPITQVPESRDNNEASVTLKRRKQVTFDSNVTTYEHVHVYDSTESLLEKKDKGETFPKSAHTQIQCDTNNLVGYRYENCLESDDELEDLDDEDYDLDEDEEDLDDEDDDEEEEEVASLNTIGSNRNVLKPVENLTQWKALKSEGKPLNFNRQKENLSTNFRPPETKNQIQETAFDASLSNWLISSDKNTKNNMSHPT